MDAAVKHLLDRIERYQAFCEDANEREVEFLVDPEAKAEFDALQAQQAIALADIAVSHLPLLRRLAGEPVES